MLLLGAGPSLLSQTLFKAAVAFGSVSVPQVQQLRSPYEEEYGPQQHTHVSSLALASGGVAVVASPKELPAEQAVPWAASVLAKLQPVSVLVVVPLPVSASLRRRFTACLLFRWHIRCTCRCLLNQQCVHLFSFGCVHLHAGFAVSRTWQPC